MYWFVKTTYYICGGKKRKGERKTEMLSKRGGKIHRNSPQNININRIRWYNYHIQNHKYCYIINKKIIHYSFMFRKIHILPVYEVIAIKIIGMISKFFYMVTNTPLEARSFRWYVTCIINLYFWEEHDSEMASHFTWKLFVNLSHKSHYRRSQSC